jgi:hypothetical protein
MSLLSRQNLYLRLLILFLALVGTVDASLRQVLVQILLYLAFFLLNPSLYLMLLKALRRILLFFAGYWLFATVFGIPFPQMLLFSAKITLFVIVTVYAFGNLSWERLLHDTKRLRSWTWGERLVSFFMATTLFFRSYSRQLSKDHFKAGNSIGSFLDRMIAAGQEVYGKTELVRSQMDEALRKDTALPAETGANLFALLVLALMAVTNSL